MANTNTYNMLCGKLEKGALQKRLKQERAVLFSACQLYIEYISFEFLVSTAIIKLLKLPIENADWQQKHAKDYFMVRFSSQTVLVTKSELALDNITFVVLFSLITKMKVNTHKILQNTVHCSMIMPQQDLKMDFKNVVFKQNVQMEQENDLSHFYIIYPGLVFTQHQLN